MFTTQLGHEFDEPWIAVQAAKAWISFEHSIVRQPMPAHRSSSWIAFSGFPLNAYAAARECQVLSTHGTWTPQRFNRSTGSWMSVTRK
jgi:hypothetical protein